jgi:hypothetical protein
MGGTIIATLLWDPPKNHSRMEIACIITIFGLLYYIRKVLFVDSLFAASCCWVILTPIIYVVLRMFGVFNSNFTVKKFFTAYLASSFIIFFLAGGRHHPHGWAISQPEFLEKVMLERDKFFDMLYRYRIFIMPCCCGIFALVGRIVMRKFGISDPSFAAKKFLIYHLTACCLFFCAEYWFPQSQFGAMLFLASLCIFTASFPFHGWIEHFFSHAPILLVFVFLTFICSLVWSVALRFMSVAVSVEIHDFLGKFSATIGILGCLFVPILFFSKRENRKFLGYALCWQNGILWTLLSCCKAGTYIFSDGFSLTYCMPIAFLLGIISEVQKRYQSDDIIPLGEIYRTEKFFALAIGTVLVTLGVWPLFVLVCKFRQLPCLQMASIAISCLLYFGFLYRAFIRGNTKL